MPAEENDQKMKWGNVHLPRESSQAKQNVMLAQQMGYSSKVLPRQT